MKKIVVGAYIFVLLIVRCSNDDRNDYEHRGVLEGVDPTFCGCCGGWIIQIDGLEGNFRIENVPDKSDVDLQNDTFPMNVKLNYELDRECGGIEYLTVIKIEKVN